MTVILSFLWMKSWKPSKPITFAYVFWFNGGKLPVFIEMVPPDENAMLSSRSEFQANEFTLIS